MQWSCQRWAWTFCLGRHAIEFFFKPLTGFEVQNAMDWHWIFLIAPTCALFFSSTFPDSAIFRCSSASILSTRYERNCEKNRKCPPLDPARDYLYPPWPGRGEQCAVASWFLIFRVKVSFRFYSAFHWKVMKRFMIVWSRSVLTLWCQEFKFSKPMSPSALYTVQNPV